MVARRPAYTDATGTSAEGGAAIPVETREELVSLLGEAAELEHGLACSYLYAAFSLKRSTGDGLRATELEVVDRWRATIMDVAEQEMLHLALVCNLLTAVGAAPHLRRPAMPHTSRYYPAGITIELRRFDDASLTRFIFLERPEHVEVEAEILEHPTVDLEAEVPAAAPGALVLDDELTDDAVADPASYSTVGHLYQTIEAALVHLVEVRGEAGVFIGPPVAQATEAYFDLHDLVAVTDLASARAALEVLTTQGEGVQGDWADAHYGRFLAIRNELREMVAADPAFEPSWPALDNPTEHGSEAPERLVDDPAALDVTRLFNSAYTLMTVMLLRCFAHTDESEGALRVLSRSAVDLMEDVIGPVGTLLAQMPARRGSATPTAGANFEFYRPVTLLPHRAAAWRIFHERLVELAAHTGRLHDAHALTTLDEVRRALHDIAGRIEPHVVEPR